jgi:hypothetical protein
MSRETKKKDINARLTDVALPTFQGEGISRFVTRLRRLHKAGTSAFRRCVYSRRQKFVWVTGDQRFILKKKKEGTSKKNF